MGRESLKNIQQFFNIRRRYIKMCQLSRTSHPAIILELITPKKVIFRPFTPFLSKFLPSSFLPVNLHFSFLPQRNIYPCKSMYQNSSGVFFRRNVISGPLQYRFLSLSIWVHSKHNNQLVEKLGESFESRPGQIEGEAKQLFYLPLVETVDMLNIVFDM